VRLPFRHTGNRLFANTDAIFMECQKRLCRHQSHDSKFAKVLAGRKQPIRGRRVRNLSSTL
jgi:hypothetical protein